MHAPTAKLLCWILLVMPLAAISQKSPYKFGEIPMEDMMMTTYPADSSAEAVVLSDYGQVEIFRSGAIYPEVTQIKRHVRIKILKKTGLSWANAAIQLGVYGNLEDRVMELSASTFNLENGKVVETEMGKSGVFKEKFNRYFNQQKFTLPNVKEGSVIEYTYTVQSPMIALLNWEFQRPIPTRSSEYWTIYPTTLTFQKFMQGYVTAAYEAKEKNFGASLIFTQHWVCNNVPAFKKEPFMTSETDYISRINFSLSAITIPGRNTQEVGNWQVFGKRLLSMEEFGDAINGSNFVKGKVEELIAGIPDQAKQVEAIFNFVRKEFEWNGQSDFTAYRLKEVFEKRKGSSGDLNLILIAMLKKAQVDAEPVLLSTRDHGFIRMEFPMPRQFNYVVCLSRVGEKTMLLDATEKFLPMGVLPERCLNGQGMVPSEINHRWIDLQTKAKSKTIINADFTLDGAGILVGDINFARDGYDAGKMRSEYSTKGEALYAKDFTSKKPWTFSKTEFKDVKELGKTVKENYSVSITEHTNAAGEVIYVNPIVTDQLEENPFKDADRIFPVDFGAQIEKVYICKIQLPEGYAVDELPQSKILTLPGNAARYTYSISQLGNAINFTSNFQINRSLFVVEEYAHLREFYDQVVAKQKEEIVLKKK